MSTSNTHPVIEALIVGLMIAQWNNPRRPSSIRKTLLAKRNHSDYHKRISNLSLKLLDLQDNAASGAVLLLRIINVLLHIVSYPTLDLFLSSPSPVGAAIKTPRNTT